MFDKAKFAYDSGDIMAAFQLLNTLLSDADSNIRAPPDTDYMKNKKNTKVIDEVSEKFGVELRKSEMFLVAYIEKLGGDVPKVFLFILL